MKYKKLTILFTVEVTPENIGLVHRMYSKDNLEIGQDAKIEYHIEATDNTSYSEKAKAIICLFNSGKFEDKPRLKLN